MNNRFFLRDRTRRRFGDGDDVQRDRRRTGPLPVHVCAEVVASLARRRCTRRRIFCSARAAGGQGIQKSERTAEEPVDEVSPSLPLFTSSFGPPVAVVDIARNEKHNDNAVTMCNDKNVWCVRARS